MNENKQFTFPKALTIAGSDSGGGAGIQADIKTFQELGAYGMSALTAVTAQNTRGVHSVHPIPAAFLEEQLRAIGEDMPPQALKTGMLVNAAMIETVAAIIREYRWSKLVVDPVMIAKGGTTLLQTEALRALIEQLIPLAHIITPNIPEAEVLAGLSIKTLSNREQAAICLKQMGADIVVLKGGHDETERSTVIDLYYDGQQFHYLEGKKIATKHTHGTGCTYSAAITALLAQQASSWSAVQTAKSFIQAAIEHSFPFGAGQGPTNHFAYRHKGLRNLGI